VKNKDIKGDKVKHTSSFNIADYRIHAILLVIIITLTFIIYLPSLNNKFTNWDDPDYVSMNPTIQEFSKENIKEILLGSTSGHYHPLTMLSLATDYSLGELNPKTYHITSLVLHMLNTALVFIFIILLFGKIELAAITSALFGVNTMNVEAVAWISERKTVLYTFFFLASLICYLYYLKNDKNKFYLFSLLFFILSLLSKVVAVPLAVTLLAIDWLKGRNLKDRKVIFEKIPFFALAVFFGMIAIYAQYGIDDNVRGYPVFSLFERIIFAAYAFCQTLYKLIIPLELSAFYPYPEKGMITFKFWLSLIIALFITAVAFYSVRKSRVYFFCFLFFVFNIVLLLQIIPIGRVILSDRYSYISSITFFLALGIAVESIKVKKIFIYIPLLAYILFIGFLTFNRSKVWYDSITLWTDVIEKYPKVDEAYNNRGIAFFEEKKYTQAIADFDKAISISPTYTRPYNNRGMARAALKDYEGAKKDFDKVIQAHPNFARAYYNRGNAFIAMKDTVSAIKDYTRVLAIDPDNILALNNRGFARRTLKDYKGAMEDFNKAIQIDAANSEAYANRALLKYDLGDAAGAEQDNATARRLNPSLPDTDLLHADSKSLKKDYKGALADYNKILQKDPDNVRVLIKRGITKINLNDLAGAMEDFTKVITLKPDYSEAYYHRGIVKNKTKDYKEAIEDFNQLLQLRPDYADGLFNRGVARQDLNDIEGALSDYNKAIEINSNLLEGYVRRGLLKSKRKDINGAMADYDKAISINPNFAMAYNARGVLKFNIKDRKGACTDWKKANDLGDINARGFYEKFCKNRF
jgi:protein O-mannosyl-transferase